MTVEKTNHRIREARELIAKLDKKLEYQETIKLYNPYDLTPDELEAVKKYRAKRAKGEGICKWCKNEYKNVKQHLPHCKIKKSQEDAEKEINKKLLFELSDAMGWPKPVFGTRPKKAHPPVLRDSGMVGNSIWVGIDKQTLHIWIGMQTKSWHIPDHCKMTFDLADPDLDFGPKFRKHFHELTFSHYENEFMRSQGRITSAMQYALNRNGWGYGMAEVEVNAEIEAKMSITFPYNGDKMEKTIKYTAKDVEEWLEKARERAAKEALKKLGK